MSSKIPGINCFSYSNIASKPPDSSWGFFKFKEKINKMNHLLRIVISICLLITFQFSNAQQKSWQVFSPDKQLQIGLTNNGGKLFYTVLQNNEVIIKPSGLGIEGEDMVFVSGLTYQGSSSKKIDERYTLRSGKQLANHAIANETSLVFKNPKGQIGSIDLRAYNDGVAFRYRFTGPSKRVTIENELTEFVLPDGKTWIQNYEMPALWEPSYESVYMNGIPIGTPAKNISGWAFPALFNVNQHWLLITESDVSENYFGAHLQQNCDGGIYKISLPYKEEGNGIGSIYPTTTIPFATPWRIVITGKDRGAIVESNLVSHLASPNKIGDDSWVKPGRSSWSWWSDHTSSKDFQNLKRFVDLSKNMGWEYSLVDANWNIMQGGNIENLVKYARSKNIGLSLWYNSGGPHNNIPEQPRDVMYDSAKRKAELKKLHNWGVKAIKVDFFQSDKQFMIQHYHNIMRDAAKEKIMVVFHGCTLPRGWSRTYPNLLAMEGVRGAEQIGWDTVFAKNAALYNTINVFTRNVAGSMDYTPVTFSDTKCCPHTTTNAHELALSVLYESGLMHFADSDSSYYSQDKRVQNFLASVPNVWDEIKFLQGEPGKEAVIARRRGNKWYVAGINGENEPKTISLQLPFLSSPKYKAILFSDGNDARSIIYSALNYQKGKLITIQLLPKGGFVMELISE
jgi:alpha-glucosidase